MRSHLFYHLIIATTIQSTLLSFDKFSLDFCLLYIVYSYHLRNFDCIYYVYLFFKLEKLDSKYVTIYLFCIQMWCMYNFFKRS